MANSSSASSPKVQGPNVRKLIAHKMSLIMLPPGKASISNAVAALSDRDTILNACNRATVWVTEALVVVRTAPDNIWTTDEEIAGEILKRLAEKTKKI